MTVAVHAAGSVVPTRHSFVDSVVVPPLVVARTASRYEVFAVWVMPATVAVRRAVSVVPTLRAMISCIVPDAATTTLTR